MIPYTDIIWELGLRKNLIKAYCMIIHVECTCGKSLSRVRLLWTRGLYSPWNSSGKNTGMGSRFLLPGIFPNQGSNPGLPHCRQNLYQLSHQGSPRILAWLAYPFSTGSSRHRNQTRVSWIAGRFFTSWATREAGKSKQGKLESQNNLFSTTIA